jgi:acetyl-CoA synthetase
MTQNRPAATPSPAHLAYRAARDQLISLRERHEDAVAEFRWPDVGPTFNWGVDWFDTIARGNHREALVIAEEDGSIQRLTFDEMATRSDQVGEWLRSLGVEKGDSVMLMLENQVELWDAMLGIMKLGAVILPTTTAIGTHDLADRIERGSVKHVIVGAANLTKFDEVGTGLTRIRVGEFSEEVGGPEGDEDGGAGDEGWIDFADAYAREVAPMPHPGTASSDSLLLYFTSGTTSRPKLVEHTQVSYPVGHLSTMYWLGLRPDDMHLAISSPGWAKHAWSCFFAPWIAEATIFVYNYARFNPAALLDKLEEEKVTSFCAPPTVWRMLIQSDLAGRRGSLREVVSAGEPLNPEVIGQVQKHWGLVIRDGFGQTEMTAVVGNSPGDPVKPGSMGRPLPGCPIVIIDPATGELASEGEICVDLSVRPTNLMRGYVGDAERNAAAEFDGYFHTGDTASVDADGSITYIGRTDDVFKASDYKISPFELESVLIEHPLVAEAAIVPAPDAVRLAVPKAYVVLAVGAEATDATALSILKFAREQLAPFQRIRRIEFMELPKTISGKIRRVELREREEQAAEGLIEIIEWRDDQFEELRKRTR